MGRLLFAALLLALTVQSGAATFTYPALPSTGASLSDLVPDGWSVKSQAEGDLNKDGRNDMAAVIERGEPAEHARGCGREDYPSSAAPRILLIAVAGDGGYRLAASDASIVLRADEGGIWGDPFQSLEIVRGTVVLSHYAGSAWRWGIVQRFRFQNGDWYLIGHTDSSHHTVSRQAVEYDYNLSTGKVMITATDADGRPGCMRCLKGEPCPRSKGCPKAETRAGKKVTWKKLPRDGLFTLNKAACAELLPFVPYE
ncbi:MAG: hypothetical protein ACR2PM_00805 [Hyphomicrobiales bacterium]